MTTQEMMEQALFHYSSGRLAETEGLCRQILETDPRHAAALNLLGVLAHRTGHHDAAVGLLGRAVESDPRVPDYHSNLGVFLTAAGRYGEAASACRQALALDPRLAEAQYNLGNALQGERELAQAADAYRAALAIRFDYPQAHNNLGNVMKDMGALEEAGELYRRALMLKPDYAHACSNLANVLKDMGRHDEALDAHWRAMAIPPARPDIHSNMILNLHYLTESDGAAILRESRRWNDMHAAPLAQSIVAHVNDRSPSRQLRVGYVSGDLRMHSIAFFLLPLLEARDRSAVHVTLYSADRRADTVTARMRAASDRWVDLAGIDDEAAARRIREDRIDILVDLSGHTAGNRLMLFARKPAPIQVTWLGAAATTGLDAIDYRLTDAMADPEGVPPADSEELVRLPGTAWCYAPLSGSPPVAGPPLARLGYATFGSFNNLAKVRPFTMQLWARILQQVRGSRLLVKSVALRTPEVCERVAGFFADRGIASTRIDLIADEPSQLAHLRHYDRVDVALDTFPYQGVTTTCEAMWMGVPVITLAGRRHASRIGASIVASAGHPEWVADDADDYVQLAAHLSGDVPRLAALRSGLRQQMQGSVLMDAPRFARNLEAAYRTMWQRWCGHAPRPAS